MTIVTAAEFKSRREKLFRYLGNNIAIVHGGKEIIRNGDVHYPFRQHSTFYYLTGFNEPDAIAVFKDGEFILFNRPRNPEREIWDGKREGQDGAIKNYGAHHAYAIEDFDINIKKIIDGAKVVDVENFITEQRLIKSPDEIKTLRKANEISINAHIKTLQHCKPGLYEYELQAIFTGETIRHGSLAMAYPPIVAAGKNACTLHYVENNQKINQTDLILIDAGCEFENYASDITRTYPSDGKFEGRQKAVYEIVYEAQRAAIEKIKPGLACTEPYNIILRIITQGLMDLKLLHGTLDSLIEQKAYLPYFMHYYGHWLGLDTHDVGDRISRGLQKFQPGMVLTVEPGLYISAWDIGIRIEDNIVVSENGRENLTEKLPRDIQSLEILMKS